MSETTRPRLSLRANISWTFAANLVYAASQWGMLVVLAKLGAPELVGQFALGLAISTPVLMLTNLQLRSLQATDARNEYQFGDYLGLRLLTSLLALLIIGAIVLASGYRWQTGLVILLIALVKAVEALSDVIYGLEQQFERLDHMAVSMMLRGPLALLGMALGISLSGNLLWGCAGWLGAWVAVLLGYDLGCAIRLLNTRQAVDPPGGAPWRPRWRRQTLVRLVRLSAPLGVATMLIALYATIPRYVVEQAMGEQALGIFAAIAYIERSGTTVVSAIGQSAGPRLARYYAGEDLAAFRRLTLRLLGIGGLLGLGGVLVALAGGRILLQLLYQAAYARADVLVGIMVAAGLWYLASLLGYAATAARIIMQQSVILAGTTIIVLAASLVLIPAYGLVGAALAMVVGAAVTLSAYLFILRRLLLPAHNAAAGRAS